MDRFSRILIVIFILCLLNLGLNGYLISKINKLQTATKVNTPSTLNTSPTPKTTSKPTMNQSQDTSTIASELSIIKAELRSIHESLELTGIVAETPKP